MPPTMLIENLHSIRRRVKLLGVVYGAGIVLAAAVALVLGVVFIDWLLALTHGPRLIVNLLALGALGYALYRWMVKPALIKLTLSDLAGRLEHVFPQFDDSLRSTVNFVTGKVPGSQVMQDQTIAKAAKLAGSVDLNRAVEPKPVLQAWGAGLGALALLVVLALVVPAETRKIIGNHLLFGAEPWPKTTQIDMLSSTPQRVAVGQSVDVKMRLKKGSAKQAILKYRYDDGKWQQEVIKPDGDGVYAASIAARLEANKASGQLQIKVEAGDDEVSLTPVAVVPRLDISGVVAMVTPPSYAKLPASPVLIGERPVVTVQGSEIVLQVNFNKSLEKSKGVRLVPSDKQRAAPEITWTFPQETQAFGRFVTGGTFKPNDPFRFTLHATDVDGFENNAAQEYQVIVHEDARPTVQIEEPRRNEERTPNASFPVKAVAEDDYGIETAQLVVNGISTSLASKSWTIDLLKGAAVQPGATWSTADSSTERKRFRLEYQFDLAAALTGVELKPGDVLEYFMWDPLESTCRHASLSIL